MKNKLGESKIYVMKSCLKSYKNLLFSVLVFVLSAFHSDLKAQIDFRPQLNSINYNAFGKKNGFVEIGSDISFFNQKLNSQFNYISSGIMLTDYQLSVDFNLMSEKFLLNQNYLASVGISYFVPLRKNSFLLFHSGTHYFSSTTNTSGLIFPSTLYNEASISPLQFSFYRIWAIDMGISYQSPKINSLLKVNNMANFMEKGNFANTITELQFNIEYTLLLSPLSQKQLKLNGELVKGINFYKSVGISYVENKYTARLEILSPDFIPKSFYLELAYRHKNYIFAYQFWIKTISRTPIRFISNGIKIAYLLKKDKKSKGYNAISCPQF